MQYQTTCNWDRELFRGLEIIYLSVVMLNIFSPILKHILIRLPSRSIIAIASVLQLVLPSAALVMYLGCGLWLYLFLKFGIYFELH